MKLGELLPMQSGVIVSVPEETACRWFGLREGSEVTLLYRGAFQTVYAVWVCGMAVAIGRELGESIEVRPRKSTAEAVPKDQLSE